ncbi:hypothetical protein MTR67_011615 [Solanum verrucosum]|uniref:Uncharacterized protein n=2 Tax=Solanum verrucosum TaxID=315347 RepID=A0AAF0Q9Q5_SOLVR|nr:hypothetical protein MTR67_011615 [Solanum verrucosum]
MDRPTVRRSDHGP